jgi:hypothetical protein
VFHKDHFKWSYQRIQGKHFFPQSSQKEILKVILEGEETRRQNLHPTLEHSFETTLRSRSDERTSKPAK